VGAVLQSLFLVFETRRAGRDQINCKTKFDVKTHTVELISVNADVLQRPSHEKDTTK
jgi:hypothetical protein